MTPPPCQQPSPAASDRELVLRSRAGSHDAFASLVARHARMVRALCTARIGTRDSDDAVQEVFLRAFRGIGRLQDSGSFAAYLGRIARNHCIDRLRGRRRGDLVPLEALAAEPAAPAAGGDDDRAGLFERLWSEIARLPESQRQVLLLFHMDGMSYAQVAAVLGLTESAVNQRLSRARQRLRAVCAGAPRALLPAG